MYPPKIENHKKTIHMLITGFFIFFCMFANSYSTDRNDQREARALTKKNVIPDGLNLISQQSSTMAVLPFFDDFESGAGEWTYDGFYNLISNAQALNVLNPDINPTLVTLPDAGYLPAAFSGTNMFWYGEASTGTFIGSDFNTITQTEDNGGTSTGPNTGSLISPQIDLTTESVAQLNFKTWWEIEGVDVDRYDMMYVEISTDGGNTFTGLGKGSINPVNDVNGESWKCYSSEGLGQPGVWLNQLFDLTPYVGNMVYIRFRFDTVDHLYNGFRGWFIDDVSITGNLLNPPDITDINPTVSSPGQLAYINGNNFVNGATVEVGTTVVSAIISTNLAIIQTPSLTNGSYDVTLTNPDGQYDILTNGLLITDVLPPSLSSITPDSADYGQSVSVTISGSDFESGCTAEIGGFPVTNLSYLSSTQLTGDSPGNLLPGNHNVKVANPDGQFDQLISAFRVLGSPVPILSWTGESGYSADGVDPDSGLTSTIFTFRVTYSDSAGIPPQTGYPVLNLLKNNTAISGSPFTMSEANSNPIESGRIYFVDITGLEPGNDYTYYFTALDTLDSVATGEPVSEQSGPVVQMEQTNQAPVVSNVAFLQRKDGNFMVDVYYDVLDADGDTMAIEMQVSEDAGTTWNFSCTQITGDIGDDILSGTYKHIVWDFGNEHPQTFGDQFQVKIIADDHVTEVGTVTDIDGNVYQTVKIGDQWWMAENLKVTHYRNGDAINNVTDNSQWTTLSDGAWCSYNNDNNNVTTYGLLYNWYAVSDHRNIAPAGWHVPTDAEWQEMVDYLGGSAVAGGELKETGSEHWISPNTGASNESGFSALPGGWRYPNGGFTNMGYSALFISATEYGTDYAWGYRLNFDYSDVYIGYNFKQFGFSVRCLKD